MLPPYETCRSDDVRQVDIRSPVPVLVGQLEVRRARTVSGAVESRGSPEYETLDHLRRSDARVYPLANEVQRAFEDRMPRLVRLLI
jgi:hypothetical protein